MKIQLKIAIIFYLFFVPINLYCQESNCFSMYSPKTTTIKVNKTYDFQDTLYPFKKRDAISGLSISGNVELIDNNSLIRVILLDNNMNEYLVYETYSQLSEEKSFSFDNICEETSVLDSIIPSSLKIIVVNAKLTINSINLSSNKIRKEKVTEQKNRIRKEQVTIKANKINLNNKKNRKFWYAGVTELSQQPYSVRKSFFCNDDEYNSQGLEYYESGFFVVGDDNFNAAASNVQSATTTVSSNYVTSFDWRNRHGINWMTPVKDQRPSGGCWAFGSVGTVESIVNLYYNQKMDLDLSEQDVISCTPGYANTYNGGLSNEALDYMTTTGVVNESCFPFASSDLPCSDKCSTPTEKIKIAGRKYIEWRSGMNNAVDYVDSLKKYIISKGPVCSGFMSGGCNHVMALVGWNIVKEYDYIRFVNNSCGIDSVIQPGNPLIGQTYWIFKNSYGIGNGNNGYTYIIFNDLHDIRSGIFIQTPITSMNYSAEDIKCVDLDGDGYYNWGIGSKPSSCPACVSNEEDGDDSNPNLGPKDEYGFCRQLTVPITYSDTNITSNTTWNTKQTLCGNLVISNGATLTITNQLTMPIFSTITLQGNSKLIVDGGKITYANIVAKTGCELTLQNNGIIELYKNDELSIETGAIFNNTFGEVKILTTY